MKIIFIIISTFCATVAQAQQLTLQTSQGDIQLRLFAERAPITVKNFLDYVDRGYYQGTIFHRVIPGFMIQGGGFNSKMQGKGALPPIRNEAKNRLHNERGTIAMARTDEPDSATSQFFINLNNNAFLDWTPSNDGYAVFGEVVAGMEVVDAIATRATGNRAGHANVPLQPVIIKQVVRVNSGGPAADR